MYNLHLFSLIYLQPNFLKEGLSPFPPSHSCQSLLLFVCISPMTHGKYFARSNVLVSLTLSAVLMPQTNPSSGYFLLSHHDDPPASLCYLLGSSSLLLFAGPSSSYRTLTISYIPALFCLLSSCCHLTLCYRNHLSITHSYLQSKPDSLKIHYNLMPLCVQKAQ